MLWCLHSLLYKRLVFMLRDIFFYNESVMCPLTFPTYVIVINFILCKYLFDEDMMGLRRIELAHLADFCII